MTDTISEILENTLFDLSDTLKMHLIELNENRSLFMNCLLYTSPSPRD